MVEWAPHSGCYQSLCPQSELKLPLWETLPDQWVGLKPCPIQMTTSSLSLEHVRFCMCPLRVELYFPQPSVPHKSKLHSLAFRARHSGGSFSQCRAPEWGAQCGAQTHCFVVRTSPIAMILLFVGHSPEGMGLDYYTRIPALMPTLLWFYLYSFLCRRSFLLSSDFFFYQWLLHK